MRTAYAQLILVPMIYVGVLSVTLRVTDPRCSAAFVLPVVAATKVLFYREGMNDVNCDVSD
ncbi:hypothetical protein, partial [Pseudomonas cannabina]